MTAAIRITKRSTMQEVLDAYPSAQRALFRKYHIGGCNSCGYEPDHILEEVAHRHNIHDLDEVLAFIEHADQLDRRIQVSPQEVAAALRGERPPRLVDVRTPEEWALSRIPGATLITQEFAEEIKSWPRDTPIVFYCHHGTRALDAASYFAGHGLSDVRSMTGGIDAWSLEVDASVSRYEIARDPVHGSAMLRPLRLNFAPAADAQK